MNAAAIKAGFVAAGMPAALADEVLEGYAEAKRRYYLGDHRPTEVEGGRFCEAVTRVVEHELFAGDYTAVGKSLPPLDDKRLQTFSQGNSKHESIRRHIPKALYFIYGIRNTRDVAHLGDGIDPNMQDATLVVNTLDWMMAELVRVFHTVSPDEAHAIITDLVTREVPVVEEIDGQPVCSKDLILSDRILVFLYRAGRDAGLDLKELRQQMRHKDQGNMNRAVRRLDEKGLVLLHPKSGKAHITSKGMADVEARKLLRPA
jgi:hypothetical protein